MAIVAKQLNGTNMQEFVQGESTLQAQFWRSTADSALRNPSGIIFFLFKEQGTGDESEHKLAGVAIDHYKVKEVNEDRLVI